MSRPARTRGRGLDPPLIDRLAWRDPIRSETLISQDRGLIARAYGTLLLFGGLAGFAILAFGQRTNRDDALIAGLSVLAFLLAAVCFVVYRRLPLWVLRLGIPLGIVMVTVAATASSSGGEAAFGLFYVWVAMLAGLFLGFRTALVVVALAVAAYGWVLADRGVAFTANYLIAMAAVLGVAAVLIALLRGRLERLATRLATEAGTDPVTTIPNRRAFEDRLRIESDRSGRSGEPLSLGICDLDGFKEVNDDLGHLIGDGVLRRAALAIAGAVRSIDCVARMGGDEFAVILPGADEREAELVAERVRSAVAGEFRGDEVSLTASFGLASSDGGAEGRTLVRQADIALYEAKKGGRDRTVCFEADQPEPAGVQPTRGDFESEAK
jgi:diguanylate cyclase (GGDEF)-like protein